MFTAEFNKERFLSTDSGIELERIVKELDRKFIDRKKCPMGEFERFGNLEYEMDLLLAKLDVFKIFIKQLYGIEYHFTSNDDYYGLCTEDEKDFLIKIIRTLEVKEDSYYETK